MSTAFYNNQALTLIKSLISGGMTPDLEMILAEGAGLQPGYTGHKVLDKCNRCRLCQVSVSSKFSESKNQQCIQNHKTSGSQFSKYGEGTYEELFVGALRQHGVLCIGVYRYLDTRDSAGAATDRYVITNPSNDFQLHHTDKIFVFVPYHFKC